MKNHTIYSIYDRKAGYYLPLMMLQSDADATRTFAQVISSSDTMVSQYPADFDLVELGSIDIITGFIEPVQPRIVVNGLVQLQESQRERSRYKKVLDNPQADIEDLLADKS